MNHTVHERIRTRSVYHKDMQSAWACMQNITRTARLCQANADISLAYWSLTILYDFIAQIRSIKTLQKPLRLLHP